jgi:tRNA nucleotidyltransferase (CCA-adding enzyme)
MPDYMFLLESRLSPEQRAVMMRVQELSAVLGLNVYLTGGTVRDLITGASLRDLDFSVEGNPSRIVRELEKGGAKIVSEDEKLRYAEVNFAGDCDGSIAAARDDHYVRPGTRPEIRWSTIMEDLRRRDFSLNAIAISLNPASRGLLLDPTNGLSDIERGEVRALTIHSFTNQPVRLLRVLRYAARMGFKLESRTQEWFDLAIQRDLHHTISPEDAGTELRAVSREERPGVVLKAWEQHDLLEAIHPVLAKRHPDYDAIARLVKVREDLFTAGLRPRLVTPMLLAILGRLKERELGSVLSKAGYRSAEAGTILEFEEEALITQKELTGRKAKAPIDVYRFLEKQALDQMTYLLAESRNSGALSKIRAYLNKWRPIHSTLPVVAKELEALGFPRGPKFDAIVEQVFAMQLTGRGKTPEERQKILRKLSGIKEVPKKKEKEKKPAKAAEKHHHGSSAAAGAKPEHGAGSGVKLAAKQPHKAAGAAAKHSAKRRAAHSHGKRSVGGKKRRGRN